MKKDKRHVIIYLPTGQQLQYSTKDLGNSNIIIVDTIVCELNEVKIAYKDDDGAIYATSYVGMPYALEIW
jgi:hypothetical protein